MSRSRIFVAIPAYRDRECQWTLRDMFERARYPERVFAGVCWQTVPEEDEDCFLIRPRPEQVRTANFHAREARGLGWARAKAQALWQGEEYCLQIDSHMRFVDDWDERMLELLAQCDSPDPVLTLYPATYQPPDTREDATRPLVQTIRRFLPNGLMEFGVEPIPDGVAVDRPFPTAALAGAFVFGSARILKDVPSDPEIYFNGEEPNLAVRLWTAGFDLFSPHVGVMFHYYLRKDGARHWNDAVSRETMELHERTLRRMRLLCEPGAFAAEELAELGPYGLGAKRSLAEYEAFAGVNFSARSLALEARRYPFVRQPAARNVPALVETLRPSIGTHLFVLGDDGVLFAEAKGTVHRLNRAAARIWCALEAGWNWERIAADAASARNISVEAATAELQELASHWSGEGLLRDTAAASPGAPRLDRFAFSSRDYRLLDTVVRIGFAEPALEALIHPAFAHLEVGNAMATPAAALKVLRILEWYYIIADDQILFLAETPRKLLPKLKAEVLARAIRRHDHILHLHAAAVMHAGRLVLFPAASGRGKTMLTLRLLAQGATYFSDEAVLMRRDGTVRPVPAALSVKSQGVEVLAGQFPSLAMASEHEREDGVAVRYVPPPAANLPPLGRSARPAAIIFPRFIANAAPSLRKLPPADALSLLLDECLAIPRRLDFEAVAATVETVERASCWQLVMGDTALAAPLVMRLIEDLDGGENPL